MHNLFETYSKSEIEHYLSRIEKLLDNPDAKILAQLNCEHKEELLSIAKARKRASESKSKSIELDYFNLEDLRFSTPKDIADYRAKRLKCQKIVDLCSGIGSQSISFIKTCKNVLAVEIDSRKVKYAEMNDKSKRIKFIQGNILSENIIKEIKEFKPDAIFCDPERLESEKERNLDSIKPSIKQLIEIYSKITPNLCIELPPQIDLDKLKELGNFEAEYLSYNNKLNRLNIYFGSLKRSEISVVDISGARIEKSQANAKNANFPSTYLYEVSTAISKAGLENEFANKINADILGEDKTKLLLTSDKLSESSEAKNLSKIYKVLGYSFNFEEIIKILKKNNIGKVVIKKKIPPEDYWKERKKYESSLRGKKQACLFSFRANKKDIEIVAEEI